ncbi:MAG: hypothetical protein KBT30_01115 [Clostridiales bacterium]|nr:hypothetical protein [Candidatus Apopatousia equi]
MSGTKPLTNSEKEEILLQKYYKDNFEKDKIGKVNLERNEVITNMKTANQSDYIAALEEKKVRSLTETTIKLDRGQKGLKIVAYCSADYYDSNNPQNGRTFGTYINGFKKDLENNDPSIKTIAFFGGDLLGTEWQLANLRTAIINKDGVALYWGLNKRKQRLLYDIKIAREMGAEVYLMQGAQEHKIYKETGRDIFKEVVEELNDENVKYISEGTSVICNLVSSNGKGTKNTIAFQTNMMGKAQDSKSDYMAAIKSNGILNADAHFVFNGNSAGKYGPNYFHVSGQSLFKKTSKGKNPEFAPKNYNVFTIYPEDNHELTIMEGSVDQMYSKSLSIEKKICEEDKKREILVKIAHEKLDAKINKNSREF